MLLIQKLKRYGFSLEEIQALLCCEEETFREKLTRQREILRWRQMELGMTIHDLTLHLRALEQKGDFRMDTQNAYTVRLLETAPMAVLSRREKMGVDDFGRYYGVLYERVAKEGVTPDGVSGAMYHGKSFDPDASDIELFLGIRERERADRVIPARQCAMTVHHGGYSALPEAYAALVSWMEENGYDWTDAPYDIYTRTARNGCAPQDWETEVYFPVRRREG